MAEPGTVLSELLSKYESEILAGWIDAQLAAATLRRDLMRDDDLREESRRFLQLLAQALRRSDEMQDTTSPSWDAVRGLLEQVSRRRAAAGFNPSETATFVFSLKQPIFEKLRSELARDDHSLLEHVWRATVLLDQLGLYTIEVHQKNREEVIARQQEEMLELSTPVVQIWEGVVALPLIGTLDSSRTQVVMESLLQTIVDTGAGIAIIDITGVPTVDTLVAQHLMKTVAAARLMGAECLISGIRPQIAQTIVHLGIDLNEVVTKATLADALGIALARLGLAIAPQA